MAQASADLTDKERVKYFRHLALKQGLKFLQDAKAFKEIASFKDVLRNPSKLKEYIKMRKAIFNSIAALTGKSKFQLMFRALTKEGWSNIIDELEQNIMTTPD